MEACPDSSRPRSPAGVLPALLALPTLGITCHSLVPLDALRFSQAPTKQSWGPFTAKHSMGLWSQRDSAACMCGRHTPSGIKADAPCPLAVLLSEDGQGHDSEMLRSQRGGGVPGRGECGQGPEAMGPAGRGAGGWVQSPGWGRWRTGWEQGPRRTSVGWPSCSLNPVAHAPGTPECRLPPGPSLVAQSCGLCFRVWQPCRVLSTSRSSEASR